MSQLSLPRFVLANVSAVTDRILVGGDLDGFDSDLAVKQAIELIEHGVTHVVDCRLEWDDHDIWDHVPDLAYLHHGMDDAGQKVPDAWFDKGVGFLQEGLTDPDAIVLTHCHMGINRGPSLGYALLLAEGWDPVEAMGAIRAARPIAYLAYAEQALRWHHSRSNASTARRAFDRMRLAEWRRNDDLDIANVIRKIRQTEERS